MLIIGLSGGIASGKSTACDFFKQHDVPVIDADVIVHALMQQGEHIYHQIVAAFGQDILLPGNDIDRKKLRDIIFSDSAQRRKLENIVHPQVRKSITEKISQIDAPYCVVCIPLLVETSQQDLVDRVLIIDVDEKTQRQRLQARDNIQAPLADRIIQAQATRQARLAVADDVILNNRDPQQFETALLSLHAKYQQLGENTGKT